MMGWGDKYWDIVSQLYWTPKYLGLRSINSKLWQKSIDAISVPRQLVNESGPLYTRGDSFDALAGKLHRQEEILNHLFNITFAIAADDVVSRLLIAPLRINDAGPFESLGREVGSRYGWGRSENVTQCDGYFVSNRSLVGVELKLGSTSSAGQVAKYAALMLWEELRSGRRESLGLVFILPEEALPRHWTTCGLSGPAIDRSSLSQLDYATLPKRVRELFVSHPDAIADVFDRMELAAVSWSAFRSELVAVQAMLDVRSPGDQTLWRLLDGFRLQLETHSGTGIG